LDLTKELSPPVFDRFQLPQRVIAAGLIERARREDAPADKKIGSFAENRSKTGAIWAPDVWYFCSAWLNAVSR